MKGRDDKAKFLDIVACQIELVYDICTNSSNNISINPEFESCSSVWEQSKYRIEELTSISPSYELIVVHTSHCGHWVYYRWRLFFVLLVVVVVVFGVFSVESFVLFPFDESKGFISMVVIEH